MTSSKKLSIPIQLFFIWLMFAWIKAGVPQEKNVRTVRGFVVDEKAHPLAYVNVFIKNSYDGDVSDSTGYFEIRTQITGQQTLIAAMIGYEQSAIAVDLSELNPAPIRIVLREEAIAMPEATITASSFSSGDEKGVTLKRLEIVTTPGAAADIFLAIKTFPGLAHIDEGSGLFVRGGDVSETTTILDQATVVHPYRYESPTGGTFGTITPFLVSGTFFSSGGFSAKYGDALSGVLAMQSLDLPQQAQYNFNLGLASASAGVALPLKNNKFGLRFSGNRSSTNLMFRVNGRYSEFTKHPRGSDANLSLHYHYSKSGHLKFFAFAAENQIGVKVDQPSFDGIFNSDDDNQLFNLQWTELISKKWLVQTSLSLNNFRTSRSLGVLNLQQRDQTYKLRMDSEKEFSPKFQLHFGAERELTSNHFSGQLPAGNVLNPDAEKITIDDQYTAIRTGGYLESQVQLRRGLFARAGVRTDHHNLAKKFTLDPRASFYYQLTEISNLRFSWGRYHQFPQPLFFAPDYGNPNLKAQSAEHFILGYEYQTSDTHLRAELYMKNYRNLVIENELAEFLNRGHGYARGFDLFFKHGQLFQDKLNGWISYSFLHSKRLQTRETPNGLKEEFATSAFGITHNLTVVAKYSVTNRLSTGLTFRYATGRPFTPVVAAEKHPEYDFYLPYEGSVNSERLPDFHRLDSSLSYLYPFKGNNYAVFYLGLSNLLNRQNVLGYDYSFDYSVRQERLTNFSRFLYFGVTVHFQ
ncbi:MAG: TonB-dependent receptor domain-containing protein [bacterium]